jgi:hypothetical protein
MGHNIRMVRCVIVAEHTLALTDVGIGIVHPDRVALFGADNLVDVEVGVIPEKNPAPE